MLDSNFRSFFPTKRHVEHSRKNNLSGMVLLSTHSIFLIQNCVIGKKNHLSELVLFRSDNLFLIRMKENNLGIPKKYRLGENKSRLFFSTSFFDTRQNNLIWITYKS